MSGHNKFSNIKHKKEKSDAARGRIFTKLGREIAVAVKEGGATPEGNSRLRDVIAKCKAANMPNDTIARSIKKAAGEGDSINYESITYEGYGPGGTAIMVDCLTDNRNRTAADVRHAFSKGGGNLGTNGCVSFMFDKKGEIIIELKDGMDEDSMMETVLEAGAEDMISEDDAVIVYTSPEDFSGVRENLEGAGVEMAEAEIRMIPQNRAKISDPDMIEQMESLLEMLEENDDVQNVWHNWDIDEEESAEE
ncbi:MAG: YebC/PmpR family DNA-binding transcriptional regulator [Firmicutes bacterium]|nr:YebC/PmpR family DNA-binding transcriptional regulator [Bacillota bacterium]